MKLRITLKSFKDQNINEACKEIREICLKTNAKVAGTVSIPTRIKKYCVLRSPHVDKDSREHFELRIYKRFIDILSVTPLVLDELLKYELPSGIACNLRLLE